MARGQNTQTEILNVAESAILAKGFAATSIDELVVAVGISKSGFFYHFADKNALARALLIRYIEREGELFDELFQRADELNEDPLHGFLVGLKLLSEMFSDLRNGHPGCLVAAICYQERLFDREVRDLNAKAVLSWHRRFRQRLDMIAKVYPPRVDVSFDDLAHMMCAVGEGGLILSRVLHDKSLLPRQLLLYRDFIKLIFQGN